MMLKPKSPCKRDCPYRDAMCHTWCFEYGTYEHAMKQYREERTREWNAKLIVDAILEHGHEVATHKHPIRHGRPTKGMGSPEK